MTLSEPSLLLLPILLPAIAGLAVLLFRGRASAISGLWALLITAANLAGAIYFFDKTGDYTHRWAGFGLDFSLRLYQFSGFILLAAAGFAFLVALYSLKFMPGRAHVNQFFAWMLVSLAMVNGAVLANHLVVLLFFWEGLLGTLFAMIAIGNAGAWKAATKAFIIVGVTDVCMMLGIALTGWQAHTLVISEIAKSPLALGGLGTAAFIFMMIGAISKGGSMPFHSWIPDAAVDAPLPFMAFLPASLEKLLGIYFLSRISLDMFHLDPHSSVSTLLMVIGAVTILLAVAMALVQKDYKRLLSYHAISQVGYMILGIGTAVPAGVVGGIFHMINHAMYKSCLFLTGGSVERQAGTTDLAKLGGLGRKMPLTFLCFFVAAAAISGVPLTNGFFSKELVYDGAIERGWVFYAAALLGSVLTAASFLKLGHAAYFGKPAAAVKADSADSAQTPFEKVKEAPLSMLVPMIVIAGFCMFFGLYNSVPLNNLILPAVEGSSFGKMAENAAFNWHHLVGWPSGEHATMMVSLTLAALGLAAVNHFVGAKVSGSGLRAVDHIHHAPGLAQVYSAAGKRHFDPYDIGKVLVKFASRILWLVDRIIDGVVAGLTSGLTRGVGYAASAAHTGSYALYVIWCVLGAAAVIWFVVK